jgi:poly(hydroxyalkanoate) granule-associated protein
MAAKPSDTSGEPRSRRSASNSKAPASPASLVQDSAQQIWLAGLGAFAKAQEEGSKAFQSLVKEGLSLQHQTKLATEEKLAEAAKKLSSLAEATTGMSAGLTGFGVKAVQPWDKLESIFEERVAKALAHLGMPSVAEIRALRAELAGLKAQVAALSASGGTRNSPPSVNAVKASKVAPAAKPEKTAASAKASKAAKAPPLAKATKPRPASGA